MQITVRSTLCCAGCLPRQRHKRQALSKVLIDAASLRRKTLPQGERKVKVQGAADQVKDFSMQLLIDKQRGEEGEERRERERGAANTYCMQYSLYLLGFLTTYTV